MNNTEPDDIIGELHFRGDIRDGVLVSRQIIYTPDHGLVVNIASSYDEETDLTTIYYGKYSAQ